MEKNEKMEKQRQDLVDRCMKFKTMAEILYKEYIPDENDLRLFSENPLAYEWEFRIWNSD